MKIFFERNLLLLLAALSRSIVMTELRRADWENILYCLATLSVMIAISMEASNIGTDVV